MRLVRRCLPALACAAACHVAWADRSRLDDGTDVVEAGDCQLETARERRWERGAAPDRETSIRFGCGIGWRTELMAAIARKRSDATREEAIELEGKTSLRDSGETGIGWAIAYGIGTERVAGSPRQRSGQFVAVEATLRPGSAWLVEGRLGSARDRPASRDSTRWSLAVEHALNDALEALAEVGGDDRGRPQASIGVRYAIWPELGQLELSYGAEKGALRKRRFGVSITIEF